MKSQHMWICGAVLAVALVAVAVSGNAYVLVPALACMAMMGAMMWMMMRMGSGARRGPDR